MPLQTWGRTGSGPGEVAYPRAIAYNSADDSYFVVDRLARVQHWDWRGRYVGEWRMAQWQSGKPTGLSVGPDGNVYVADTHYHRVVVFAPTGRELRQWGSEGTAPGQFIFPTDIAFDAAGQIYVSEYGDNDRIQVFDSRGKFLRQFGRAGNGPGEFSRPQSMLIRGNTLYVTDACNHRIAVFDLTGRFLRNLGSPGSGPGQFRFPYGLDMDARGNLIVAEFGNNRIQAIVASSGRGLWTLGKGGRELGELAYPWALAVNRHNQIAVVDSGNNRIQLFAEP